MSSDESASTQISTISSQIGKEQKLKSHKSEQWEINLIGNFLLSLYHRLLITPQNNWMINKTDMRKEFKNFLTEDLGKKIKELNGTDNIGTLLHRCGFILNTPRGSAYYQIKSIAIFEFRNKKLKEQDTWRINNDLNKISETNNNEEDNILSNLVSKQSYNLLEENFVVDKDEPKNLLEYQGTTMQQRLANYRLTNVGCFICQEDFSTMDQYEDHIIKHNDESEFEFLNSMSKFDSPMFTLSYRLCKNSHYFCFDIETKTENLVIEKIIIVQSRSMYYVHNTRVPYDMPDSGCEQFFVDCHLFTIYTEQPIVLICHLKDNKETRIIEQHHFMRSVEFPKVNFAINPYRLPDKKTFKPKFQLADYFPPKEIREALNDDFYNEKLMKASNEFRDYVRNEKKLQPQTIGPSLNILLQIEDLDTLKQYLNLTQRNVQIRSFGSDYSIRLRPKERIFIENVLTVFDELIITSRSDISTKPEDLVQLMLQNKDDIRRMKNTFVGQIEDVNSGRISFKCYQKIDVKKTYTVICRPSRLNVRYQYRSLEMLPMAMPFLKNFLFPAELVPRPLSTLSLSLYNPSINGNPEQLQAVRNIAEGPRNDATYIIFGPPGTGKTTTIVEAILQVLKRDGTKILVSSSSNSACDEVALRLCQKLSKLDMSRAIVRIYSRSCETRFDNIDDELLEHSNMYNGQFYPDIEVLHEYRIVICTLSVVAKLTTGKFGRKENNTTLYTHLFIDEIAASMEAEALVAITTILTPKSSLIIAGDHKQLGPILQSKRAEELGLGVSLMDRLLARECYRVNTDTGAYDRTIQTRLRLNFRSHPDIVNLFSGMYYNHDVEPKAELDDVSLAKRWHLAQNKEYPIIFHCVDAPSRCDNQSQSMYNMQELHVVMDYVKDLMYFGINGNPVEETDIGIISPYKKQYKRIQEELNLRKWFKIETGSVETFQGKEKKIIIVSFVRSGTRTLGFLENPRRLNVTISRAKSLLIMIGNPQTLSLNADFAYIIKECQRHNTIVGSASLSGDAKNQHHKRFTRSTEKLNNNNNRKENVNSNRNTTRKAPNVQRQTSNMATSADLTKVSALSDSMQKLNVKENSNRERRRRGGGRARNSKNDSKPKHEQPLKDKNKEDNISDSDDDDDEDDDVSTADTIDSDCKPSTSKAAGKQNKQDIKNIRSRESNRRKGNSGKITKPYSKGKPNSNKSTDLNKTQPKTKIESLFDELPQVPNITSNNKDNENTIKTTPVLQKPPVGQITPLMQPQQYQQQYFNNQQHQQYLNNQQQQQNLFMNNNMANRPMNPTAMHFGELNHMSGQMSGAPMQYTGIYPHYSQYSQYSPGYNPHLQFNAPSTHIPFQNNNMPPFFNNMNTANHSNPISSSSVTKSNTNITKNSDNRKSSTNSSNTENKSLKAEADLKKNPSNSNKKRSNNNNNSSSATSSYAKLNDQTAISKNRNANKNKEPNTNLSNATKSSNNSINAENKAAKVDGNKRENSTNSNKNKSNNNTSSKESNSVRSSFPKVNDQTATTKNLNTSKNDIKKTFGNTNKSSAEAVIRPNVINTNTNTSNNNKSTNLAPINDSDPKAANCQSSIANSTATTNNITHPTSTSNNTFDSTNCKNTSTVTPAATTPTSTSSLKSSSFQSTGAIKKFTTSSTASATTIATANVRPIVRSTSTVTPATTSTTTSTISSGSSLTHNSTNNSSTASYYTNSYNPVIETRRSMPVGNTTPRAPEIINRPVSNYSNNHFNAPEQHYPHNVYVYNEDRRPVRNLQFGNQNSSNRREPEEKKCIIS